MNEWKQEDEFSMCCRQNDLCCLKWMYEGVHASEPKRCLLEDMGIGAGDGLQEIIL